MVVSLTSKGHEVQEDEMHNKRDMEHGKHWTFNLFSIPEAQILDEIEEGDKEERRKKKKK